MSTTYLLERADTESGLIGRTLGRHGMRILALAVVGTVVAYVAISMWDQPLYKNFSIIRIDPPATGLINVQPTEPTLDKFFEAQVPLITSPDVLTAAAANPKVASLERIKNAKDVVQELKKIVDVKIIPATYLIEVSMVSSDTNEGAAIVNAVVDAYLESHQKSSVSITRTQIKSLEDYQRKLRQQIDELEKQWKEFVAHENVDIDPVQAKQMLRQGPEEQKQAKLVADEFKAISMEINRLEFELVETTAILDAAKAAAAGGGDEARRLDMMLDRKFQFDPHVLQLAAQIKEAQEKLEKTQRATNLNESEVQAARKKYDSLKEQYDRLRETKTAAWREEIQQGGPSAVTPEREIAELEARSGKLNSKLTALTKQFREMDENIKKLKNDLITVQVLLDRRQDLKAIQEAIQRRLEQLRYEARGEIRIRKVNEAVPAQKPINNRASLLLTISPCVMLFASFALFLVVEAVGGSKRNVVHAQPAAKFARPDPLDEF